nr:hypothetical protein Iba_chr10fCG5960 [Ipomoea batatas]
MVRGIAVDSEFAVYKAPGGGSGVVLQMQSDKCGYGCVESSIYSAGEGIVVGVGLGLYNNNGIEINFCNSDRILLCGRNSARDKLGLIHTPPFIALHLATKTPAIRSHSLVPQEEPSSGDLPSFFFFNLQTQRNRGEAPRCDPTTTKANASKKILTAATSSRRRDLKEFQFPAGVVATKVGLPANGWSSVDSGVAAVSGEILAEQRRRLSNELQAPIFISFSSIYTEETQWCRGDLRVDSSEFAVYKSTRAAVVA